MKTMTKFRAYFTIVISIAFFFCNVGMVLKNQYAFYSALFVAVAYCACNSVYDAGDAYEWLRSQKEKSK